MKEFEFKPKAWVLGRNSISHKWRLDRFGNYENGATAPYRCVGLSYKNCIPYEGNEHLLGTTEPYESTYEPKDGDFMINKQSPYMFIYKTGGGYETAGYVHLNCSGRIIYSGSADPNRINLYRLATEEEKKKLLNALHKIGVDWDAEEKKLIKYEWVPKIGDAVYVANYNTLKNEFAPLLLVCDKSDHDNFKKLVREVRAFADEDECRSYCDRITLEVQNVAWKEERVQ